MSSVSGRTRLYGCFLSRDRLRARAVGRLYPIDAGAQRDTQLKGARRPQVLTFMIVSTRGVNRAELSGPARPAINLLQKLYNGLQKFSRMDKDYLLSTGIICNLIIVNLQSQI